MAPLGCSGRLPSPDSDIYVDAQAPLPPGSGEGTRSCPFNSLARAVAYLPNHWERRAGVTVHLEGVFRETLRLSCKGGVAGAPIRIQPWVEDGVVSQVKILGPSADEVGASALWPSAAEPESLTQASPLLVRGKSETVPYQDGIEIDNCRHIVLDGLEILPRSKFIIQGFPRHGISTNDTSFLCLTRLEVSWVGSSAMILNSGSEPCDETAPKRCIVRTGQRNQNRGLVVHNCRINQVELGWYKELSPPACRTSGPKEGVPPRCVIQARNEALTPSNYRGFVITNNHISNSLKVLLPADCLPSSLTGHGRPFPPGERVSTWAGRSSARQTNVLLRSGAAGTSMSTTT